MVFKTRQGVRDYIRAWRRRKKKKKTTRKVKFVYLQKGQSLRRIIPLLFFAKRPTAFAWLHLPPFKRTIFIKLWFYYLELIAEIRISHRSLSGRLGLYPRNKKDSTSCVFLLLFLILSSVHKVWLPSLYATLAPRIRNNCPACQRYMVTTSVGDIKSRA